MSHEYKTPMMKQYKKIKEQYPDCILFFRLGDFYEMFLEDAKISSKIMGLTLTARNKGSDGKIPMCGIPYHAIDTYIPKMIKAGHKIAICEQIGEVEKGPGIVDRAVVKIITNGTLTDEKLLDKSSNNYILAFETDLKPNTETAFAYADFSTGEFYVKTIKTGEKPIQEIQNFISQIRPKEIVLIEEHYNNPEILNLTRIADEINTTKYAGFTERVSKNKKAEDLENLICKFFNTTVIHTLDFDNNNYDVLNAIGTLISFFNYTQKQNIDHFKNIKDLTNKSFMNVDANTINNLEIFASNKVGSQKSQSQSLFDVLDNTQTAMGARMLKQNLLFPSIKKDEIENRLNIVEAIINNHKLKTELIENIKNISDIQRLFSKIGLGSANARDVINLSTSLANSVTIFNLVKDLEAFTSITKDINKSSMIKTLESLISQINETLKEDPPVIVRIGKMIKDGINQELDDLKASIKDSQDWIANLEMKERERTGISKLKVGFNSVFGYYIEIGKLHIDKVPENYIRKQTLVSSERYITEELKFKEEIVLNAQEKINELEYKLFINLLENIKSKFEEIQTISQMIARIDYLLSFAIKAIESNYTKPKVMDMTYFNTEIKAGRHPVVESVLNTGDFTPNDIQIGKNNSFYLITGPNMAGKSTYIRQIAIIQLMMQIGSYVPADYAKISIVDGIYTRIGAGDALAQGLSTFMVEMIETARILRKATANSLIILDEVGRGTGTLDGLSIAASITEYIHETIGAKTLFATHFHELINLDKKFKKISNFHIEIREDSKKIHFLHKLQEGGANKSYGIEVAKMAGIPKQVIDRANNLIQEEGKKQLSLGL